MAGGISADCGAEVLQRKLLLRLERARTRLAVVIASESKATTPESWRKYRETETRMRRCVKGLRAGSRMGGLDSDPWRWALEALSGLTDPVDGHAYQSDAQRLCRRLAEILEVLEKR